MPHNLQSDSNTMNLSRIRRCMIEPEEIWSKNTEEKELSGNFAGLQKFATCEFRRLLKFLKFAGCEISQHCSHVPAVDCFLTRLFVVLYKFSFHVIFIH